MSYFAIENFSLISALGSGKDQSFNSLFSENLPIGTQHKISSEDKTVFTLPVSTVIESVPSEFEKFNCRNNQLSYHIFKDIQKSIVDVIERYGVSRVGIVLGSSTSGLDSTEIAFSALKENGALPKEYSYKHQHTKESHSRFLAELTGITGPAYTVSTACSSSAKAMISAAGLIKLGICDAVITGGVDTLCDLTVNGFFALGQLGEKRTNPLSLNRAGLSIGEGGALFVMTREHGKLVYAGGGESLDAHHISAPDPDGTGAESSMKNALTDAKLSVNDVDYVNLHGTGTKANDSMESQAVQRLFGDVPCSSTKPFTGHCLGASGAVEAAISLLVLSNNLKLLPPHKWDGVADSSIGNVSIVTGDEKVESDKDQFVLSNSFAFGGSNSSVILGNCVNHRVGQKGIQDD